MLPDEVRWIIRSYTSYSDLRSVSELLPVSRKDFRAIEASTLTEYGEIESQVDLPLLQAWTPNEFLQAVGSSTDIGNIIVQRAGAEIVEWFERLTTIPLDKSCVEAVARRNLVGLVSRFPPDTYWNAAMKLACDRKFMPMCLKITEHADRLTWSLYHLEGAISKSNDHKTLMDVLMGARKSTVSKFLFLYSFGILSEDEARVVIASTHNPSTFMEAAVVISGFDSLLPMFKLKPNIYIASDFITRYPKHASKLLDHFNQRCDMSAKLFSDPTFMRGNYITQWVVDLSLTFGRHGFSLWYDDRETSDVVNGPRSSTNQTTQI